MKQFFYINDDEVATLVLLNIRLDDMIAHDEINPEVLPEVEFLQDKLEQLLFDLDEKPLISSPTKALI